MIDLIEATDTGIVLFVKIIPNASRTEIVGQFGDRVKVSASPEKGKANKAVCACLASALGVNNTCVSILHGESSPLKTIFIFGISILYAKSKLGIR